jgi:predicted metal-dependent hydrolase
MIVGHLRLDLGLRAPRSRAIAKEEVRMGETTLAGDPPIKLLFRRSPRARRISLRVSALDGRVTLSVPRGVPKRQALAFAEERRSWIERHLSQVDDAVLVRPGVRLPVEGVDHLVRPGPVLRALRQNAEIIVPERSGRVAAHVKKLLQAEARARLEARSHHYAAALGQRVERITLRDTRSRWGSCTSAGNLMFSWRLILAPPQVLDYVAAHEAAHLVEMNHSPAYWDIVARIFPEFDTARSWLRQHGTGLHRFRFEEMP